MRSGFLDVWKRKRKIGPRFLPSRLLGPGCLVWAAFILLVPMWSGLVWAGRMGWEFGVDFFCLCLIPRTIIQLSIGLGSCAHLIRIMVHHRRLGSALIGDGTGWMEWMK